MTTYDNLLFFFNVLDYQSIIMYQKKKKIQEDDSSLIELKGYKEEKN